MEYTLHRLMHAYRGYVCTVYLGVHDLCVHPFRSCPYCLVDYLIGGVPYRTVNTQELLFPTRTIRTHTHLLPCCPAALLLLPALPITAGLPSPPVPSHFDNVTATCEPNPMRLTFPSSPYLRNRFNLPFICAIYRLATANLHRIASHKYPVSPRRATASPTFESLQCGQCLPQDDTQHALHHIPGWRRCLKLTIAAA